MSKDAMLENIETLSERYIQSTMNEKNTILSEFCATSGYESKYAIKLLGGKITLRTNKSGLRPFIILTLWFILSVFGLL
jgi:hypothetical protein